MRILLCDDHAVFRAGVKGVLDPLGAEFVEAGNAAEALALLEAEPEFDLILLDLAMPGPDGLTALRTIRSRYPTIPVVIVSGSEEPDKVREALDGGASGFIPKSSSSNVVRSALDLVLDGSVYIPPLMLQRAEPTERPTARRRQNNHRLTERQGEVAQMMSRGLTNAEIAEALEIAESTVKTHISAILDQLDVTNRTEAVMVLNDQAAENR